MGVKLYKAGDHPTGWLGFRVTRAFGGRYHQKYFSTRKAEMQNASDPLFREQERRAKALDHQWELESREYQYRLFVTQDHKTTKPYRGVGAHGITLTFFINRRGNWRAAFRVNHQKRQNDGSFDAYRVTFDTQPYSEAWRKAVTLWAEENDIRPPDAQRLLESPPAPSQFKDLRRHMNEHDGFDIPVSALSSVFREQREQLENKRLLQTAEHQGKLSPPPKITSVDTELVIDMERWFTEETDHRNAPSFR